jgi:2-keto-4-pentenoate hydratase/2-oxohepta-3-ene-1,7-dioic acid hydratase in catechol pathway
MSLSQLRLFRFGPPGAEQPGVILGAGPQERALDVSDFCDDYDEAFFRDVGVAGLRLELELNQSKCPEVLLNKVRIGPPVARPSKVVGVGLNYRDHAKEMASPLPDDPKLFMKATSAITGVYDVLPLPSGSTHTDYEVELALVIGRVAKNVKEDEAINHIAGYTICNDYSERDWQKNRHGQFVKGKSADGFAPLGPVLVPADCISPADLRLWLSVNKEMRQDGRTRDMVFDCATLVARISQYMTLLPGDVITTGTPSGVGLGMTPPTYLKAEDIVHYGIDGIGEGKQEIR